MRYYFHLTGAIHHIDQDGHEFADLNEARLQAVRSAGELLRDQPDLLTDGVELRLEVSEADGATVFVLTASGRTPADEI